MSETHRLAVLAGDFIGPEVTGAALEVLRAAAARHGFSFEEEHLPFGGNALDSHGSPLPDETLSGVDRADAVLLGAAGGPVGDHPWNRQPREKRVESGILGLRKHLGVYANLRPVTVFPGLERLSPLREEVASGTDLLILRELTGGIYFGRPSEVTPERGLSTMVYERFEVERIARMAFETARGRDGRVTSVDKANVLEPSRLWRQTAARVMREEFPDVTYDVVLVDAMAMHLLSRPRDFDVVVTANLFGDILTDEASMLPGSLGMLPSASIGSSGPGLYEPIHGSAPDIAGKGIANPLATILAAAMMLRHSLQQEAAAVKIEDAVRRVLADGLRTTDIAKGAPGNAQPLSTAEMVQAVLDRLQ